MTKARTYNVVTLFCGLGAYTLGTLRARSRAGSRFRSIGAFDIDAIACKDFELLTGEMAQVVDLGKIKPWEMAKRCEGVPDVVVMSPPCKGYSGCLPESMSKSEKYEALNKLAYDSVRLALKSWPGQLPKLILLENVPRMLTRGADWLAKIKRLLRRHEYDISLEPHDCGEWGGLAQKRERLLLVARLRTACPSFLLRPPNLGLQPMSSVLWQLPAPVPHSTAGGPHHRLPEVNALNWLRLAAIPPGFDWRCIPERVHLVDVDPRMGGNTANRQTGFYGVCSSDEPGHTVIAHARCGNASWANVADTRLGDRATRHNGGFGVGNSDLPAHAVLGEGTVRNTFTSVEDRRVKPRLGYSPHAGTMGVGDSSRSSTTVIGSADIHNSPTAIADDRTEPRFPGSIRSGAFEHEDGAIDPRSTCSRFEDALGVSDIGRPYKTPVIGHQKIENSPSSIADTRVTEQRRGNFRVQDPRKPSATIRGEHRPTTSPASVADERLLFQPTHELVAGQPWTGDRDAWTRGDFWLVGPEVKIAKGARGTYLIIRAPDGTVHRPMTTAELMLLQGIPVWHRPGDPTELELGDPTGQWVQLGGADALVREHVGNAVPVPTAQAIGEVMLDLLDQGATEVYQLSSGGVWVREGMEAAA